MGIGKASLPHELRTTAEPRQNRLHTVRVSHVEDANSMVRLIRLTLPFTMEEPSEDEEEAFAFLPGQWLDIHIPSVSQVGGFTITSTPADARRLPLLEKAFTSPPAADRLRSLDAYDLSSWNNGIPNMIDGRPPYVELAVQASPYSLPAAWFWRPRDEILGKTLNVRVGGSFVWPPSSIDINQVDNIVFIAGGVGINPLISILSHFTETPVTSSSSLVSPLLPTTCSVCFLYSSRVPPAVETELSPFLQGPQPVIPFEKSLNQILFLPRLRQIMQRSPFHDSAFRQPHHLHITLDLFLTNIASYSERDLQTYYSDLNLHTRRISRDDLCTVTTGPPGTTGTTTVCYVCGPAPMTDEFVGMLGEMVGLENVFYEKWW